MDDLGNTRHIIVTARDAIEARSKAMAENLHNYGDQRDLRVAKIQEISGRFGGMEQVVE